MKITHVIFKFSDLVRTKMKTLEWKWIILTVMSAIYLGGIDAFRLYQSQPFSGGTKTVITNKFKVKNQGLESILKRDHILQFVIKKGNDPLLLKPKRNKQLVSSNYINSDQQHRSIFENERRGYIKQNTISPRSFKSFRRGWVTKPLFAEPSKILLHAKVS